MRIPVALVSIAVASLFVGCGAADDSDPSAPTATGSFTDIDIEPEPELEPDDWYDFDDVIGDDSYGEARLKPEQPAAGQPAKVQFLAGSFHGVPAGVRVWTRIGDPAAPSVDDDPNAGPPWTEMTPITGRIYEPEKNLAKDVSLDYRSAADEQGEILFEAALTFAAGRSPLEFKILAPFDGATEAGFHGWNVTAREASAAE